MVSEASDGKDMDLVEEILKVWMSDDQVSKYDTEIGLSYYSDLILPYHVADDLDDRPMARLTLRMIQEHEFVLGVLAARSFSLAVLQGVKRTGQEAL